MIIFFAAAALLLGVPSHARDCQKRPKITAIAQVSVYSTDLENSKKFYGRILGLAPEQACGGSQWCFRVNPGQEVNILPLSRPVKSSFLAEVAFSTDDIQEMHCFLDSHGIETSAITMSRDGSRHFKVSDPEGNPIAFVQSMPVSQFKPASDQISRRLLHAGFVVHDRVLEDRFYRDLLGFRMYWHGGFKDADEDWWEIQVPDGNDWIEYMLNIPSTADHKELGVQNHFSLGVEHAKAAVDVVRSRGLKNIDGPEIGRDGKWSADIYDPDLTRVELMEFVPAHDPCCNSYTAPHPRP